MIDYGMWGIFFLICGAEICSFAGVLKQNYGWFAVENSFWTSMATVLGSLGCFLAYEAWQLQQYVSVSHPHIDLRFMCRSLTYMTFFAFSYVTYQVKVDLPMYYNRWVHDTANNRTDNALLDGASWNHNATALQCKLVTRGSDQWRPNVLWLTMYFLFVPLSAIGLSMGPRIMRPSTGEPSQRAQQRKDMVVYKPAMGHDSVVCAVFVMAVLCLFSIVNQQVKMDVRWP
jgi:hypothetical protein